MPSPTSTQVFTPTNPVAASASRRGFPKFSKKLLIPIVVVIAVVGSASAFYFGYYTNPSVIYSQSLSDTGKGYDKLVNYANQKSKAGIEGYTGSGSYQIKSPSATADGKIAFKDSAGNSDTIFDIGTEGVRVTTDIRTIKSAGTAPDIYVKVSGIKGLGTTLGAPELNRGLSKLDSRWIVIDHTLIDSLNSQSGQSGSSSPTRQQLLDEAQAFGEVNKQYLFSTAKDKAVTKVVKKYGMETVDGHKTYHYLIALQKDNVKKYILAQLDALKASKLNDWLKKNNYAKSVYSSFNDAANSTKDIKSSDTYDIWMDVSRRVVYKVRVSYHPNPADNYVDVGLNYKGGNDYPFFISGKSKDSTDGSITTYSLITDINTDTSNTDFKFSYQAGGSNGGTITSDFSFKPNSVVIKIDKPGNAIPYTQALNDLGYSSSSTSSASSGGSAVALGNELTRTNTKGTSADTIHNSLLGRLLGQ